MGFMEYIQKTEGRRFGWSGSGLRLRMPMVNVFLGNFERQEIEALREELAEHISGDGKIFWISHREAAEGFFCFPVPETGKYGFRERENLRRYGAGEGKAHILEALLELAGKIFNSTSAESFRESGSIRLNLLVKPDEAYGGLLEPLCRLLEEAFGTYYDVSVVKDLYLMSDQRAYDQAAKDRKASNYLTLTEADRMMEEGQIQLAYFLSNIDNRGRLLRDSTGRRYGAAALLMLIKTAIPDGQGQGMQYSDEEFGNAVAGRNIVTGMTPGKMSSIGYMRLESNGQLATLAACRCVWNSLRTVRTLPWEEYLTRAECDGPHLEDFVRGAMPRLRFSEGDWQAIVRSREVREERLMTMTRGDAMEQMYGRNLDLYLELNCSRGPDMREKLQNWSGRFQNMILSLSRGRNGLNSFETEQVLLLVAQNLEERKEQTRQILVSHQNKLNKWKDSRFGEISRKRVSAAKDSVTYLRMAEEYLKLRWNVEDVRRREKLYAEMLRTVQNLLEKYRTYLTLVEQAAEELSKEIAAVLSSGQGEKALQVLNSDVYYEKITEEILQKDEGYSGLQSELSQMAAGGVTGTLAEKIYARVFSFCRENILQDARFHQECLSELFARLKGFRRGDKTELNTEDEISDFILQSIDGCRYYMCRDSLGGQNCHEEMCFLLNGDSGFADMENTGSIAADLIRNDKLRLFCEKDYGSLDILFLAGNIRTETLYQFGDYRKACEELTKEQ